MALFGTYLTNFISMYPESLSNYKYKSDRLKSVPPRKSIPQIVDDKNHSTYSFHNYG